METEYEYLTAHQRRTYRILHSILRNLTEDDVSWMCVQIVLFLKASYPQVESRFFFSFPIHITLLRQ